MHIGIEMGMAVPILKFIEGCPRPSGRCMEKLTTSQSSWNNSLVYLCTDYEISGFWFYYDGSLKENYEHDLLTFAVYIHVSYIYLVYLKTSEMLIMYCHYSDHGCESKFEMRAKYALRLVVLPHINPRSFWRQNGNSVINETVDNLRIF